MNQNLQEQASVVPWLYWSLLPLHRLFLSVYFRQILIEGLEQLPVNGPAVLAPKHLSRWDPVILGLLSVEPLWFMTNANQFEGVQGWFLPRLGAFPVDPARPKVSSFRTAIAVLQARKKLVVFPEGGIVPEQPLRSLKPGLARLVLQAEALSAGASIPIVPIALRYCPRDERRAAITIRICPPLYAADFRQAEEKQTAVALTQALEAALLTGLRQIEMGAGAELA